MVTLEERITSALKGAYDTLSEIIPQELKTDKDIMTNGDLEVGEYLKKVVLGWTERVKVVTEEFPMGERNFVGGDEQLYVCIDDIDGTDNYARGNGMLQYASLIVVFQKREMNEYYFDDIIAAGCVEHSSGKIFYSEKGMGRVKVLDCEKLEGVELTLPQKGKKPVIITDIVSASAKLIALLKEVAWLKDFGASATSYCHVGIKLFDAYVSDNKKGHELGLLYMFCTENGLTMCSIRGLAFKYITYDFNLTCYKVVAGDPNVCEEVVRMLRRNNF